MIGASLICLATAIYFEARSEPLEGQYAVAEVIVNRAESPRFPDTVCDVIHQDLGPKAHDCQFSFTCDGKPETIHNERAYLDATLVAYDVLYMEGTTTYTDGALFYHTRSVNPGWSKRMEVTAEVGAHVFLSDEDS
ncbi:cell wall hydrolase [Roseobacter phage DSS3P8]|nr:cell wall hydrolase [Roseobacter phage DSS3P8]